MIDLWNLCQIQPIHRSNHFCQPALLLHPDIFTPFLYYIHVTTVCILLNRLRAVPFLWNKLYTTIMAGSTRVRGPSVGDSFSLPCIALLTDVIYFFPNNI